MLSPLVKMRFAIRNNLEKTVIKPYLLQTKRFGGLKPVSYTHLDVYKRQGQRTGEGGKKNSYQSYRPVFIPQHGYCIHVSSIGSGDVGVTGKYQRYRNQDVYKRQVPVISITIKDNATANAIVYRLTPRIRQITTPVRAEKMWPPTRFFGPENGASGAPNNRMAEEPRGCLLYTSYLYMSRLLMSATTRTTC